VVVLASATGAAALTKSELIERSGEICAHGDAAMQPYDEKAARAIERGDLQAGVRPARKSIRIGRRHLARLADLNAPQRGIERYRNFIDRTREYIRWLDLSIDAIAAERWRLAKRRATKAQREYMRAKRAARRYPLKRACIKFLS